MNPRDWARVEAWFHAAVERPPVERAAYLDQAVAGEPALRAKVEAMLVAHEEDDSALDHPVLGMQAPVLETPSTLSRVGHRFGPWEVVESIDSGGMGSVYLARRAEGDFEQRAAVKVMRRGSAPESAIQRFLRERQTLARLEHPNIARLMDGGSTEDGEPYLVMEYVEGAPIDDWCDQRSLPVAARLKLFRVVCGAVHHAHRNLIVHRDIKPSNVLVTADGVPKLLDFGIARILSPDQEPTVPTQQLLTPEYASPEQLKGEALGTPTDVYSLGVLLYQLLAGRRPFEAGSQPTHELVRRVCEDPPVAPSQGLDGDEELARRRGVGVERLRRLLTGDLDNVVLMALRKEPERRYASVEQVAADIDRHLGGLPVIARRDTLRYRTGKFVGRHRASVIAATVALVVLGTSLRSTTLALARERREAVHKEKLLRASLALARGTATLIGDSEDYETVVREYLAPRAAGTPGDPDLVQSLMDDAFFFHRIGRNEVGLQLLNRALEVQAEVGSPDGPVRAEMLHRRGWLRHDMGLYEEAERDLMAGLEMLEASVGVENPSAAGFRGDLALLLKDTGKFDAAERMAREAMETVRRSGKDPQADYAHFYRLATIYADSGRWAEAEPHARRSLELCEASFGGKSLRSAGQQTLLGRILIRLDRAAEALGYLEPAHRAREQGLPILRWERHKTASILGEAYVHLGRLDEARQLLLDEESVERIAAERGPDHYRTAQAWLRLVDYYEAAGDEAKARQALDRVTPKARAHPIIQHSVAWRW